jgi:protein TonB
MFDQTFVDGTQNTKKPLTLLASTLVQIAVLCVLLLIPFIYTATLPSAILKSLLVAPRPPVVAITRNAPKTLTGHTTRLLSYRTLVAPIAIPKQVNPVNDIAAPPGVAVLGTNGSTDGSAGSPLLDFVPSGSAPPPLIEEPKPKTAPGPVKISTGAAEAKLINKVIPLYPALAKATHVQGTVEFRATISKDGYIENLQVVRGHPMLVKAASEAVLQWKYRPTLLNGQPVEVLTEILVNFTLTQ